jgi:hypothetical protein
MQGCRNSGNAETWLVDEEFSNRLLHPTLVNGERTKNAAYLTVDSIQVYRIVGSTENSNTVSEVRRHKWVWESSSRSEVLEFFDAALAEVARPRNCIVTQSKEEYAILAYDRDLMRAALIRYFACPSGEGALDPYGSPGVTFSKALAPLVQRDKYWPP